MTMRPDAAQNAASVLRCAVWQMRAALCTHWAEGGGRGAVGEEEAEAADGV